MENSEIWRPTAERVKQHGRQRTQRGHYRAAWCLLGELEDVAANAIPVRGTRPMLEEPVIHLHHDGTHRKPHDSEKF